MVPASSVWNDRPHKVCDVFPISSVLDFKAGYLADADVAFELVSCQTFRLI